MTGYMPILGRISQWPDGGSCGAEGIFIFLLNFKSLREPHVDIYHHSQSGAIGQCGARERLPGLSVGPSETEALSPQLSRPALLSPVTSVLHLLLVLGSTPV